MAGNESADSGSLIQNLIMKNISIQILHTHSNDREAKSVYHFFEFIRRCVRDPECPFLSWATHINEHVGYEHDRI